MGREKIIGAYVFPTRKAAEEAIRSVLHHAPLRVPLTGDEFALISALVSCHPDAEARIGAGIASIDVRIIDYGQRGFWITRVDGTMTDFSYRKALDGAPNQRTLVLSALRREVREDIDAFRREVFALDPHPVCPLTGQPLAFGPDAHVDHSDPTFVELAEGWVLTQGGWDAVNVCPDDGPGQRLVDHAQHADWIAWHRQRARLRVVHRSANLARYRRAA